MGGLLGDLADADWRIRDRAAAALVELGEPIEAELRRFVDSTSNAEACNRANVVLNAIDVARRFGPTRVSLKLDNVLPPVAFDELARQGGIPIRPHRESFWKTRDVTPISVNLSNVPFWEGVKEVCARSGVRPMYQGDYGDSPRLVLVPDLNGDMANPHTRAGACTVVLGGLNHRAGAFDPNVPTGPVSISLVFYADPRWKILTYPEHTEILDLRSADGTPLPKQEPLTMQFFRQRTPVWIMRGTINGVDRRAEKLGAMRGRIRVTLIEQTAVAEIKDVLQAANRVSRSGGHSLQLAQISTSGQECRMKVILTRQGLSSRSWRTEMETDGIQLLDDQGRPLRRINQEVQEHGDQIAIDLTYMMDASATSPKRLTWQIPLEPREIDLPFSFKELPFTK